MSYGNMDEEIKEHQTFLKQSEITIGKLSLFVREFGKNGVKFIESSQKKMDEFFSELKKEDNSTTLSISLGHIYNEYTSFFKKMKAFFDSIDKTIGGKITDFEKDYKTKNKENLAKLSKLSMQINERKKKLDEVKNGYFDASREIKEIEKKMDPNKLKDDELLKMTQKKISAKEISEERKSQYQREVRDFNNFLETKEDEYLSTKAFFKNDQNDKLLFYIDILSNSNAIIKERNEVMEFTIKKVNKYKEDINIRRDLKLFDQDFNRINSSTKKRYMKEHFLNYDLRNKTDSLKDGENNDEEVSLDNQDSKYMKALQILELGNDDFIDMTSLDEKDIEFNKKIMNLLENENKIEGELFLEITNYYKNNINHSRRFMYLLVNYFCVKEFVKIKNYDNFNILKNILCEIINYCFDKKEIFDIVYLIMFIANKTIYYNKEKNTVEYYLCNEMSNNKIFKNNDFWLELLNKKLNMISEVEITKEMEKRRNSLGKEDSTIVGQAIGKLGKFGKFFGIGNNNKAIEKEIIFNQMFQRYSPNFCNRVISDYIRQFINYNYDGKSSLKVIENLSNKYKLPKDYLEYYKKVIETNEIIRKKMNKNKNISIDKGNYDKYYFNFKGNKKFEGIADTKIYSLIFSLKFLDVKEYPKILCLNKDLNKKLMKIIYKNILFKYFDKLNIKTHISIWKILLNYTEVKKKYNYTKILEEVEKDPNLVKNLDIIGLDVIRTSFDKDEPIKRKKIGNILKAVAKEIPSLNYCQGMNQIASFLLDVCDNDEEESFFVFLCLLLDSDYSNLFKNDLEKLNILFYQFDRILSNTLPEIYTYLKNNKITPGFFISPWFITIFTDAFIDKEELNNKKIIMKIFDQFILGGWKAIVKIGLSLLKYNEVRILNTPIEELLNYLTNDIIKSTYFDKDNFDDVMNASIKFKINGAILSDTEKQYNMQKQLAPLE
jgi:hypothetical protein